MNIIISTSMNNNSFIVEHEIFFYTIQKKAINSLSLKMIDANNIVISAPLWMNDREILSFLEKKKDWLIKNNHKIKLRQKTSYLKRDNQNIYFLGKEYSLIQYKSTASLNIIDNKLIYSSWNDDFKDFYKLSNNILAKLVDRYLLRAKEFLKRHNYQDTFSIEYKEMRSRWGVCYPGRHKIILSSYLIHLPLDAIEYTFFHECAHFIVFNHSKQFYQIVSEEVPDYPEIRKKMH